LTSWVVYILFLISGVSGLVYQVIWVREFGSVFGNTVHSASAVTAVFMCGLGVGSFVVGRFSDRRHRNDLRQPLRAYGVFEIGIGLLGLGVALALPELEGLSAHFSQYELGREGWFELTAASHLFRYAAALLLLAPITFLMGGTLTLLIRYVVADDLGATGWRVGALYGVNTLGAALGAFATDFALIPNLGILKAELVAVALNGIAGVGALLLAARRGEAGSAALAETEEDVDAPRDAAADHRVAGTAATLFATGFVAMGFEIVWFRYLISGLGAQRSIFSLLMGVILVGIALGSILGGHLVRRHGKPVPLFLGAQTSFIFVALAPMAAFGSDLFRVVLEGTPSSLRVVAEIALSLPAITAVVGLGALLMGCTFPFANAHVQRVRASVGGRAGALYLANTFGNVAGSLVTGFLLLPTLGQQRSLAVLTGCGAIALVPLYLSSRSRKEAGPAEEGEAVSPRFFAACIAGILLCLGGWLALPEHHLLNAVRQQPGSETGQRVVAISEGINESIVVLERIGERALYTNGHSMSATGFAAQRYMRLFAHFPLLNAEDPRSVLVICFGVGTTLHAASLHPSVERLDVVDLSKNVLRQAHYFSETNRDVLEMDRVSVHVNDGRQHLRMQPPASYDLITLEPPPIAHAGVASLYTTEFYSLARSRLGEGGFMTQWLPAYQVSTEVNLSIIRSFLEVFPNAALLSGFKRELILVGSTGPAPQLDPARIRERLDRNPALREELEAMGAGSLTALAAAFVAGPLALEQATRDVRPVTDDLPLMEYSPDAIHFGTRLPRAIFDSWELRTWCPGCFDGRRPIADLAELTDLVAALRSYHQSDGFLDFPRLGTNTRYEPPPPLPGTPCRLQSVRDSRYFTEIFGCQDGG